MPSRRRQISATAPAFDTSSVNVARAASARSTNNTTASVAAAVVTVVVVAGTGSDRNGHTCSPPSPRPSRLVARIRTPGHSRNTRSGERRDRAEELLTVVQHQQQLLGPQVIG